MVRRACPRETRDRDPMAPSRVPQVLDLALATPAHRSALHQCWPARADPSHGCGEPDLGRSPIHGELRMLGIAVSERTVSRYLPRQRPSPGALKRWIHFLRNHREVIAAMHFFAVPTATF